MPERAGFEVNEPGRVEGGTLVAGFEVQVRAGRAAGGTAQADDIAGADPVSGLYVAFGQMAVVSLKTVGMANHHQITIASYIVRDAHAAVKGGRDGRAGRIRQIDALMPAAMAVTVLRTRLYHIGAHIGIQGIYNPQGETVRDGDRLLFIGIHGAGIPEFRKDAVGRHHAGVFHIAVGAVVVQHHLHGRVTRIQGVCIRSGPLGERFQRLTAKGVAERIGLTGILLGLQGKACTN